MPLIGLVKSNAAELPDVPPVPGVLVIETGVMEPIVWPALTCAPDFTLRLVSVPAIGALTLTIFPLT